ncbi:MULTISPECIES: response regulator transcription factor [unclassified Curtobacterium]|uniref:response regulator n=1 Tax=unclassified Curtobacterium TaxID=257496 RepID=UPI000D8FE117|nr:MULTISPECIES: response regulator transcription factor [unclassified Curtobacterium]PYY31826.1 DNA-binding response regulator [Curtobacterium sp. MCBD17_030]PZE38669.1 DNA-binding response regulator [Curtobacterium sp. MCPF17_031]
MIRVVIVDDQAVVRTGLGMMVDAEPDLTVVGQAPNGAEAIAVCADLRPDVVLMDVRMPVLDGISATRSIVSEGTAGAVVILTTFDDEEYLLDAVQAGALGFLLKDAGPDLIAAGVRAAHTGDTLIAPSMTRALLENRLLGARSGGGTAGGAADTSAPVPPAEHAPVLASLSAREREVLTALVRGASNAQIAKDLWISEATVKTHISSVLGKVGAASRVQAVVFAYESGFVRPDWSA